MSSEAREGLQKGDFLMTGVAKVEVQGRSTNSEARRVHQEGGRPKREEASIIAQRWVG
jgi:hypothetical protein